MKIERTFVCPLDLNLFFSLQYLEKGSALVSEHLRHVWTCEDTSQRDNERLGCLYMACWNIDNSEIDWYNGEIIDWHLVEGNMCMCWKEREGGERHRK